MDTELITFSAADGFPLDGLVFTPADGPGERAVLLVHGKVMNFYTGPCRILPPHLVALGWSCLAMNRRGHDLGGIRNGRDSYGGAWEIFADSQSDIAGGMTELQRRGFRKIVLAGHSFGGISAAAYAASHPVSVAGLVLCSAGSGGKEYLPQVSRRGMLAAEQHAEVDARARRLVAEGQGDRMIALPGWWYAITAASWVDLAENVPNTVENARRYPGPILTLRGSLEPEEVYPAEAVAAAAGKRARLHLIDGADHFYNGVEEAFVSAVREWFAAL
ncbi:MAG: alpha/beta hydrolase [Syntrophales bacterium]